jgi:hypothetical protein
VCYTARRPSRTKNQKVSLQRHYVRDEIKTNEPLAPIKKSHIASSEEFYYITDSSDTCLCFRAVLTDCKRRCLSARRAASSFSDSCDQRAIEVPPETRDISDPTDVADDADDDGRRINDWRRREPCCLFIDIVRTPLVRGISGGSGRYDRRGGTRDAWGDGVRGKKRPGVSGRGIVLVLDEDGRGSGTPRICTMPAPSRVSSSVHGREVIDDAAEPARATAEGVICFQS